MRHIHFSNVHWIIYISDKELGIQSGILRVLDMVPPGKSVMADSGFEIQNLFVKLKPILNILPFKGEQTNFPLTDVLTKKSQLEDSLLESHCASEDPVPKFQREIHCLSLSFE